MEIILHIGTSKTGTSSIQSSLYEAREKLLQHGILYPDLSNSGISHNFLVTGFISQKFLPRQYQTKLDQGKISLPFDFEKSWKELLNQCSFFEPKKLILSGEYFAFMEYNSCKKFISKLLKLTDLPITVVAYIRRPSSHYNSQIQQKIKASHCLIDPFNYRYKFKNMLLKWLDFDSVSVEPNFFHKAHLKGNDVIYDFWSKYIQKKPFLDSKIYTNTSISAESAYILWDFRRRFYSQEDGLFRAPSNRLLKDLINLENIESIKTNKFELKQQLLNIVDSNHLEDIQWFEEQYKTSLDISTVNPPNTLNFDPNDLSNNLENLDMNSVYEIMQCLIHRNYDIITNQK